MRALLTILCVAASITAAYYCREDLSRLVWPEPPGETTGPINLPENGVDAEKIAAELNSRLIASGWSQEAAEATIALNLDRYCWLRNMANTVLEREIKEYESLRPNPLLTQFLEKHPEMAGVMLMAYDPDAVANGILKCKSAEDTQRIIGSFVKYTDKDEMSKWAAAVARHGPCIAGLLRRCPAWPIDDLFVFPPNKLSVTNEYSQWLDDVLLPTALPETDEETSSLIEFIILASSEIRTRMDNDFRFLEGFRSRIWPAFARCVRSSSEKHKCRPAWELFASTPEIWDLLKRSDGEALFERAGPLAADILYGKEAVHPDLREKAAQLLLLGNQELVEIGMLSKWNQDLEFRRLMLDRNLTDDQLLTICQKIDDAKDGADLILQFNKKSDQALAVDIGPPPEGLRTLIPGFAIYYAGKKMVQGSSIGPTDVIGIAGDILTVVTIGGSKVLLESGKQATKAALSQALKKEAVKDIARLTSKEIAEQAGERELGSILVHQALKRLPEGIREQLLKSAVIDVTCIARGGFKIGKQFGLGRKSMDKLTSLEARVFMRKDAKVLVSLPSLAVGNHPCAMFLNATAVNGLFDATFGLPPVQAAMIKGIKVASTEAERQKQNLACWWSGLAIGAFDK